MVRAQCDHGSGGVSPLETVFVGRAAEMADLVAAVDSAKAGHGRAVFVGGEPGIGKTSLARHARAYARERGLEVWWGRCRDGEPAPPYWPWIELLRSGALDLAQEPLAAMLVPSTASSAPAMPGVDRFVLFDRFITRLVEIARERPLLLVFDDLHGADRSSLSLLQLVVQRVATAPMLTLGLYRDVDIGRRHPLSPFLAEVAREPGSRRLRLRGLGPDAVRRFLEIGTGLAPTDALVEAVLRQTGGNPFFIKELVRLEAGISHGTRIPQSVREVIGRRLDGLSAECDAMLAVAAGGGAPVGLGVVRRVGGGGGGGRVQLGVGAGCE